MPKTKKAKYHLRNWKEYNRALVGRGSLTFWIEEGAISGWLNEEKNGKRGRPYTFADLAINCMSMLKAVYHLPLRATQGMTVSILELMKITLTVPSYSTLSRRRQRLEIKLPHQSKDKPIHLVVDSSGIKVYGEGEWKVRQHGWSKRRTWRKLHLGVDESTGEIIAAVVTDKGTADKETLPDLLAEVDAEIGQVSGDGGYDYMTAYQSIAQYNARASIPPRRNALIWNNGQMDARDENVRRIRKIGRKKWKKESNYHRRSLAENAFFRYKLVLGDRIYERLFDTQACEILIRCAVLNKITHLGMPDSYVA